MGKNVCIGMLLIPHVLAVISMVVKRLYYPISVEEEKTDLVAILVLSIWCLAALAWLMI